MTDTPTRERNAGSLTSLTSPTLGYQHLMARTLVASYATMFQDCPGFSEVL